MQQATCSFAGKKRECFTSFAGYIVCTSPTHKLLVWDDMFAEWRWKQAKSVTVDDWCVWKEPKIHYGKHIYGVDTAWFLGACIGDGCLLPPKAGIRGATVQVACGKDLKYLQACSQAVPWKKRPTKKRDYPDGQFCATWYSKELYDYLFAELCNSYGKRLRISSKGHKKPLKRVPRNMFLAAYDERLACLAGLVDSDGSISATLGVATYVTIHRKLALDVQRLAYTLGILAPVGRRSVNTSTGFAYTVCFPIPEFSGLRIHLRSKKADRLVKSHVRSYKHSFSFPPSLAKKLLADYKAKTGYRLPSSRKVKSKLDNMVKKISGGRGCGHEFAQRIFSWPKNIRMLKYKEQFYGTIVPMWDMHVLGLDKRIIGNGVVSHNSDLAFEVVAPEGRESEVRVFSIIKGRNTGYTEVAVNLKLNPFTDISESGSKQTADLDKYFATLEKIPTNKKKGVE